MRRSPVIAICSVVVALAIALTSCGDTRLGAPIGTSETNATLGITISLT